MTVSLGILSTAHSHANSYASVATTLDDADVVAVADDDADRGEAFAARHGIEYAAASEVLDRIDAGVICAANANHADWIERAAAAGVDVLCEKPLALTAETARSIVDTCADAGVVLGVAMPVRFCEPIRQAKARVDASEIGELNALVGTNLLQRMAADTWLVDPELSGGGAVMDHSVHIIDLARWFTGHEVAEVYAETGTRFSDIGVEDIDVLSMKLEDGTPVTHDGSWRQPEEWEFWGDVTLRLIGTDGVIEVDCFDQTFTHTRAGDESGIDSVFWGTDMNEGLLRDFVNAVQAGHEPAVPGEAGLREVHVVEAAYQSAEETAPVTIEY